MTLEHSGLPELYDLTIELFRDEERITRALDWVDEVLPVFAAACRQAVRSEGTQSLDRWLDWLDSDSAAVIAEAGKGEVYRWRTTWMRVLLRTTSDLHDDGDWTSPDKRECLAQSGWEDLSAALPACFPLAYWHDLIEYLANHDPNSAPPGRTLRVIFPLVLSEPIVDGGVETDVIPAQFVLEAASRLSGEVFLHPEQAVVRCMDEVFAGTFRDAAVAGRFGLPVVARDLPGVRVRIETVKPSHERFLCGAMLRGESGGGALAVGLREIYTGRARTDTGLAVSFAVHAHRQGRVDGNCHPVAAGDDKVRGCAKQGIQRLLVAKSQQSQLALYGHKHNVRILGAASIEEAVSQASGMAPEIPHKIVVLCHLRAEQDGRILNVIEQRLTDLGCRVFVDRQPGGGLPWAQEMERRIREADAVIPLLSPISMVSDMLASELQTADEARQAGVHAAGPNDVKVDGPRIIPVRVAYDGPLPERIAYILDPLPQITWRGGDDDEATIAAIMRIIEPEAPRDEDEAVFPPSGFPKVVGPASMAIEFGGNSRQDLEPFDGLVPLKSRLYIERDLDRPFLHAVAQRHSVILVKGARQMGKSSLMARGLAHADSFGARVVVTDFQKLSLGDLGSIQSFYLALARMLARQLKIGVALEDVWVDRRSANLNFEEYVEDHILPQAGTLVWAMDEVDKLFFATSYSSDVFGLFRSWANERQGRVGSPWAGVSMIIAYATEAHLFITDINQSPFNVGTRFEMTDFTQGQVAELNRRYGSPLRTDAELQQFYRLVGGHPYLARRGLYAIVTESLDIAAFERLGSKDNGPLGDHLRRLLTLLARNPDNLAAVREVLVGKPCPSFEAFYHLRSAGILVGESAGSASIRCQLYRSYLERCLLG
ncbi:MAG: AAA-like domain-containing protein [Capsulimonadaceae bacterium]